MYIHYAYQKQQLNIYAYTTSAYGYTAHTKHQHERALTRLLLANTAILFMLVALKVLIL